MAPEAEKVVGEKPNPADEKTSRPRKSKLRRSIAWWRTHSALVEKTFETVGWGAVIAEAVVFVWWLLRQ